MKILHYALGFPPYRSGGLTKFCVDLMLQQVKEGHEVAMIWPGQIKLIKKKTEIKNHGFMLLGNQYVQSFEIINPLPVSFDEGILDIYSYMREPIGMEYEKILQTYKPDVVHVHTLMGLHKEFLEIAKKYKIRVVFTAHDFFPICPKVTMFRNGQICKDVKSCKECSICNLTALSLKKIYLLQSPLYRKLKDVAIIKKLRKQHRDNYLGESLKKEKSIFHVLPEDYQKLRNYYYTALKLMDVIHYNSFLTKNVYEQYFDLPNNQVITITHGDIRDHRKIKKITHNKLRIRYLGPASKAKGYFLLKEALDELWKKQQNFCLDIHFTPPQMEPYINVHERYNYNELKEIFEETDVLIAPSIWYETFGFTVIEALSYGVPVILSGTVGAKDVVLKESGIVIEDMQSNVLCQMFNQLSTDKLQRMNAAIVKKQNIMMIHEMSKMIEQNCYKCNSVNNEI